MAQLIGEMILSGTPERARLDIVWAPAGTRCPRADAGYLFKIFVGTFPRDYHKCTTVGLKAGHHALCASLADFLVKENTMKFTWRGGTYPLKVLGYSKGGITFVPDWEKIGWPRNGDWGPFASCNWPTGFSGHVIFEAREVPPGVPEPEPPVFVPPTPPIGKRELLIELARAGRIEYKEGDPWISDFENPDFDAVKYYDDLEAAGKILPEAPPVPPVPPVVKKLTVSDFRLSPREVLPRGGVAATVRIKNEGTEPAAYSVNVTLEEDGITVKGTAKTGTLAAGAEDILRWGLVAPDKEGSWRMIVYWDDEFTRTDQWVTVSKVAPPETELHKAWREFAENKDILTAIGDAPAKAIGLLASSTIESFSRVFTGYSYIDDKAAEPRPGDYAATLLIISGAAIAGATTVYTGLAAMPAIGTGGVMKGMAGVSGPGAKEVIKTLGIKAAAKTLTKYALRITGSPFFKIATVAGIWGIMLWNFTDPLWWRNVFVKMSGDVKRRFEGLRIDVETKLKQSFNLLHIRPTAATRTEALSLLRTTGPLITELFKMLAGLEIDKAIKELYPEFEEQVKAFVTQYNTLIKEAGGVEDDYLDFGELRIPEPVIATTFPEEFLLEDVMVEDGDTLMWPGHPEAKDRIRIIGIDTHEIETAAGKEEAEYLKSLIEHKQVTIKVTKWQGTAEEREKLIDRYGRLLGGVFLGDTDIALAMLEHFGKAILTPTKYQDKYRWIDWDLYKKTAAEAAGPAVREFKINIDSVPSNAKLYIDGTYTGHWTPANQKELKDVIYLLDPGEHVFRAAKAGKEASVRATITDGVNPDIILKLGAAGLEAVEPVEVPAPPEEPVVPEVPEFKINILSTPSRGKVHIDDIYLHHLTPMNEIELQRGPYYGIDYFTPGEHVIRVTKGGKAAEKTVTLTAGDNGDIFLTLGVVGLPRAKEDVETEIAAAEELLTTLKAELAAL